MRLSAAVGEVGREQAEAQCPGSASRARLDAHGEKLSLTPHSQTLDTGPHLTNGTVGEICEELTGEFSSLLKRHTSKFIFTKPGWACM